MAVAAAAIAAWIGVSAATVTTVAVGIAVGAVIGAGMAIIKGGDILQGALSGALIGGVSAGIFSAASAVVSAAADAGAGVSASAAASAEVGGTAAAATGSAPLSGAAELAGTAGTNQVTAGGLLSPTTGTVINDSAAVNATGAVVNPVKTPPTPNPTPNPAQAGMSDATSKIYAGLGQGAAQGLAGVGQAMMEADAKKDLYEQQRADELADREYAGRPVGYKTPGATSGKMTMTKDGQPYPGASAAAAAPADVSANLATQTANTQVPAAKQLSNVGEGTTNASWWASHLAAPMSTRPTQQLPQGGLLNAARA